ncbi:hypothetical protein Vadar_000693 [Vaccinium darrowii]|uniref:Uncharacterized protein n=1 Tax=Vaccinium darrowii TaxID=229202 RepID=A0ACB7YAP1_9ERIC|nr:hypothetical protein Vadar_000693 [Vaccinium darrowii]
MRALVMLLALFFTITLDSSCGSLASNVSCLKNEREALIKFKGNLIDEANRLRSWVGKDCCTWEGIGCSRRTGHVIKLDLRNQISGDFENFQMNELGGGISPLVDLKDLSYLDLSGNNLSGVDFLGSLKSLRYLNLSSSNLVGKVPHNLGNLSRLQYLDLNSNDLVGPIPNTLARLTSLTVLDLSFNHFNDTIKMPFFICNLSSLSVLKLHSNDHGFEGPLPSCMGNMTQLTVLDLCYNQFTGEIPNSMKNLYSLRIFDLSSNDFSGEIVSPLYGCIRTSLEELNLGVNSFTGQLPNYLGEFKNLERLLIDYNSFSGPLPSSLGRLSYLRELDASYNQLNGSIPVGLGQLSNLQFLDLYNNSLNGTIPVGLGQLSNLQSLDLSYNSLGGMVYEQHFTTLKSLKELRFTSNSLVINVSSQWVPPFQLQVLKMASCTLGPQFPPWLQTQRHVTELDMSNASISDIMPNWFEHMSSCIWILDISNNHMREKGERGREREKWAEEEEKKEEKKKTEEGGGGWTEKLGETQIKVMLSVLRLSSNKFDGPLSTLPSSTYTLDLSNNLFSGPIPMGNYSGIEFLALSNNHFSGVIPVSLCSAATTGIMDLSKNHLSGRIPRCLGNLGRLIVLDLSSNSLHGQIPNSLGFLQQLGYLHLRNNSFHGELPLSLQNLTSIRTLDLGENSFMGVIPPWIGDKLSGLVFLSLQSNNFYGSIPVQLCHLSALQLLNLAHNNITGDIPSCFQNFTAMVALEHANFMGSFGIGAAGDFYDPYDDKIDLTTKGREQEYTKILQYVTSIDLSANRITGEIPEGLTALLGLLNLNLSGNHLAGRIPEKIGRIPTGNQLQTLDDWSIYAGNDGLCGAPLTKSCPGDEPTDDGNRQVLVSEGNKKDDETELLWFCAGVGPGFVVGLLGFFCTLYFKRKWRHLYFQFVEDAYGRIFVAIVVRANRLRKKFHPQRQIGEE